MFVESLVLTGQLLTVDHKKIQYTHYQNNHRQVVIIAHGFFINKDVHLIKEFAKALNAFHDVIIFDFRGHGKSSGWFEWTSKETYDLDAVVQYAKKKYAHIGVIGFSLGAATTIIGASQNADILSVVAVSAPSDFWKINYHFWEKDMVEDLKLNLGIKGKGKGVRPGNPFSSKVRPIDVVRDISPIPILFIHGQNDWLIKPQHSKELFNHAKEPKQLAIIPGAGHAERIYDTHPKEFLDLCVTWFDTTLVSQGR